MRESVRDHQHLQGESLLPRDHDVRTDEWPLLGIRTDSRRCSSRRQDAHGKAMVPSNDRIILDEILNQPQSEVVHGEDSSEFFEFLTAQQVLKEFDLSYESGIVEDGGDGGVDYLPPSCLSN